MSQLTIQQAFNLALQHHKSGRLADAEQIYHQILQQQPTHPDALHYLGLAAYQSGRHPQAIDLIRQSLSLQPGSPEAHCNLAIALKAAGHLDQAILSLHRALQLKPDYPQAHYNLALALHDQNHLEQAIAQYHRALSLNPNFPEALNNLANALKTQNRLPEAINAYRQAIALKPNYAQAYTNLGSLLRETGQLPQAIAACRHAVALNPHLAEAHSNLGNALRDNDNLDEAIAAYRQAIALAPTLPEPHTNLGNVLRDKGLIDQAIAATRRSLSLNPDFPEAHRNLAHLLLLQGNLPEGWKEHEWRWQCRDFSTPRPSFPQPQWDGSSPAGRTILIHAEQGFGDTLQFIRYLPLLAQRGAKVLLQCPPELHQLLHASPAISPYLTPPGPLPPFDLHCPLLSLPLAFQTTLENIPPGVPYLQPETTKLETWRTRLAADPHPLKVGLAWAGNPHHKNDRNRSLPPAALAPLAQLKALTLYSLQKQNDPSRPNPPSLKLIDHTPDLNDFADTAALIANLDLIISADTAIAHLAGALGKKVWTLLPFVPDWRWLLHRPDTPWYPTMTLLRQPSPGDWDSVIRQATNKLGHLAEKF